ncbi:Hypp1254 [Branchiostoma lanceolatum]|uniref:Hypp1254 protein n=1 Tax=Branchiostoma lanceolatum TaxID=7740 RepID=A0A8J9ZHM3_BRALA|nr:Hypp1254 [Branchiostoma lanceolatum]
MLRSAGSSYMPGHHVMADRASGLSRTTCILLMLMVWLSVGRAQGWTPEAYPNPQTQPALCGRPNTYRNSSWICDPDGILTRWQADELDEYLESVRWETPCPCDVCDGVADGYNIAVALLRTMTVTDKSHNVSYRAQNFANYLRTTTWDYGSCDEGVVILISQKDRRIYTSVGKEVGLKLTPFRRESIYEKRRGIFSIDDYQLGLATLVFDYKAVLIGTYQDVEEMAEQNLSTVVCGVCVALSFFFCCGCCLILGKHEAETRGNMTPSTSMGTETAEILGLKPGQGYTSVAGFGGGDAGADAGDAGGGDAGGF